MLFYIFAYLIVIILIVLLIVRVAMHFINKKSGGVGLKGINSLNRSREDSAAQFFYLISLLFLGLSLLILNKDFGQIVSWEKIIFVTAAIAIFVAYRFKAILALLLGLSLTVFWWVAQNAHWIEKSFEKKMQLQSTVILGGLVFLFLIFYILAQLHNKELRFKRFALSYNYLGLLPIVILFFALSTEIGLEMLQEMTHGLSFINTWQIAISMFLLIIVLIISLLYALMKKSLSIPEAAVIILIGFLFLIISFLPEQSLFISTKKYYDRTLSGTGYLWAFIFNLLAFLQMIGIIFLGYFKKEEKLVNLGAFFLFLFILMKYFDWFFTFMNKSIFFIGAGILLFAVGWFMEKGRRYMIATIKTSNQDTIQF